VYANAPTSAIVGNNNVRYNVVRIAAQHFTGSADNTMTKPTACAFAQMAEAAARAGIRLTINSGFRTLARQQYFWNCYQTKRCNNGHLAAHPGTSNHGKGQALDINTGSTSTATYRWMAANASRFGFRRTVPTEPWHWEHIVG
jgi:LAS superfamily LD-carboxypeptidase LdcB